MSSVSVQPWRLVPTGILLRVRLTPKAARDAVEGMEQTAEGPALKARVRAVPEDGAANAAVETLIAEWLGIPRTKVSLTGGSRSRVKSLTVSGNGRELARLLGRRLAVLPLREERKNG